MEDKKLVALVDEYQSMHGPRLDVFLSHFKTLEWPGEVIHDAVHGRNGEIHSHQWRLRFRPEILEQACEALAKEADQLEQFKSFARLRDHVEYVTHGVDHFADLAVYDTSLRLGAHLNRWPKVVYLHAGARIGYEALTGLTTKADWVEMDGLPEPLHVLQPYHAENFLCIFKDRFGGGTGRTKPC